jgi:hypothetical protein
MFEWSITWNDREHRSVNDTKTLDSMNLQLIVYDALFNVLGQAASAAWVEPCLRALQYSPEYMLV